MKRVFYYSLCAVLCVSMLCAAIPVRVMADEGRQQEATAEQTNSGAADAPGDSQAGGINTNESGNELSQGESDTANPNSNQSEPQASLTSDMSLDAEQATRAATGGYQHSDSATSGSVTLTVEWNDPVLGQPTTFHVSAAGGSGSYLFRMDAPSYSNPNEYAYEPVADPSRGEWTKYTDACESHDFTFTTMATGTYNFRFYLMDKAAGVYYLRTNTYIQVADDAYPSVASIVNKAVSQAKQNTNGSEYEMALYLHDWLLDQLEYDNSLKWSSAESALTRGLGTCQAYESAYAKLLSAAGIENAETRDTYDGHTWNAVKLDDEWYQVDCTWDDTSDNFYGDLDQRHLYFCLTDELMAIAHPGHEKIYTTDDYATRSTNLKNNYFVRCGKANEWMNKYVERIQKHLEAREDSFSVDADNQSFPPSISGIQNGIVAHAMNQRKWLSGNDEVNLTAASTTAIISGTKWLLNYNFFVTYRDTPTYPSPAVEDGDYVVRCAPQRSLALSSSASGCELSASASSLSLAYDGASGAYKVSLRDGSVLTSRGESLCAAADVGSARQRWLVTPDGPEFRLTCSADGRALDCKYGRYASGVEVWPYAPNGGRAQAWVLEKVDPPAVEDGDYVVRCAPQRSLALSSSASGCELSASASSLSLAYDGASGAYKVSLRDGSVLTSRGESLCAAADVGSARQRWLVTPDGPEFRLTCSADGRALDCKYGRYASGVEVWPYAPNGGRAQAWVLEKVDRN